MSVTITDLAEADLEAVWSYVAADDPVAADDLLDRIMGVLDMLASTPQAGRIRNELGHGVRSYSTGNFWSYTGSSMACCRFYVWFTAPGISKNCSSQALTFMEIRSRFAGQPRATPAKPQAVVERNLQS